MKETLGREAAGYVKDGMTIGVGTGSTAFWFIAALGDLVKSGLACRAVPTSLETDRLLRQLKVPVISLADTDEIDLTIDGADEVDHQMQLIKGGGGALLREKMVAFSSRKMIIIADETKLVKKLGAYPLPVEVIPYGYRQVSLHIKSEFGIDPTLRIKDGNPLLTDNGHYIIDCPFGEINDAAALHIMLNNTPGVVDNGLFLNLADNALIGYNDGTVKLI
ncbi:ribose 5-phosphate isomerase [Flavihumibacter solisilvae]|uniref:Ribose-5-phosphate isomerase A n=1 Tax=Flavihumibacter solisilvae TaxID=1349421 RepID=A0A0C1L0R4_9BACT|nr:ribose 5-phosphate isomerase [Flavihumibacter solisilvae]